MSDVLAFKIIDVERSLEPSLNIIDDEWIVDQLDTKFLNFDGKGILIVEKAKIKRLISKLKKENMADEDKKMYSDILQKLLSDCGEHEYCVYDCIDVI